MRLHDGMEGAGYKAQGKECGDVCGGDDLEEELGGEVLEHCAVRGGEIVRGKFGTFGWLVGSLSLSLSLSHSRHRQREP